MSSLARAGQTSGMFPGVKTLPYLFLTGAALVLAAACSSGTPPPSDLSPPADAPKAATTGAATAAAAATGAPAASSKEVPREEFAARLAQVLCEQSASCCAATGAVHDPAFCAKQVTGDLGWAERATKSLNYDGKSAARCIEEVRPLAAKCSAARDDVMKLPACARTFQGTGKTGEPCGESTDCAHPDRGAAFCWTSASGDGPGRCALSLPPERGAPCFTPLGKENPKQTTFSECNEDPALRCVPSTLKCGSRLSHGAPCEQHYECAEGALCWSHRCKVTTGAFCSSGRDCAVGQACVAGKCGPGKKIGESCSGLSECADSTCAGNTKRCSSWAGTFLCKAPPR